MRSCDNLAVLKCVIFGILLCPNDLMCNVEYVSNSTVGVTNNSTSVYSTVEYLVTEETAPP